MAEPPVALSSLDEAALRSYEADPSLSNQDWQLVVAELARRGAASHISGRQYSPVVAAPTQLQREAPKGPAKAVIVGIKLPFDDVLELVVKFSLAWLLLAVGLGIAGGLLLLLLAAFGASVRH